MRYPKLLVFSILVMVFSACATYYQKNQALMEAVYANNYEGASKILDSGKLKKQKRNQLLYYVNKGTILFMNNQPAESNKYFQQADYFVEDYQKEYGKKAASFLTNPSIETYEGENFEKVLIHYYTTLNYLQQNLLDEALVECKRMQLKLDKINDYYKGKNKYKQDALVYLLSGIVYDAQKDYNSAFIAYRNAYNVYRDEYTINLNTPVPDQLKKDLIRTALLTGFKEEARQYKDSFNMSDYKPETETASLVAFWNNGFGPVKDQWSINFTIVPAGDGWVNFTNWDLGLNFPYYVGNDSKSLASLKVIRVAFPKYISRIPTVESAEISIDSLHIANTLQAVENIDKIAYVSLQDRMLKEMAEALVRLAIKQISAAQLRKENDALGSALSVINAVTEQADTRNWQTLPHTIYYTRMPLAKGSYQATFKTSGGNLPFNFTLNQGRTVFKVFQSPYFKGYSEPLNGY